MATFLELCRTVHRYVRIGEDPPGTAPETVADQEGVLAEIVSWVQDAYADIQSDQDDWRFRQKAGVVPAAARTVDPSSTLDDFDELRFYTADYCHRNIQCTRAGGAPDDLQPVWYVEWADWNGGRYERGQAASAIGKPNHFTVQPDGAIRLYPTPDAAYELHFPYQRTVHVLDADQDAPILPSRHHMAIVWRALMIYADTRDSTQELYQKWERRRRQSMRRLYRDELPEMHL